MCICVCMWLVRTYRARNTIIEQIILRPIEIDVVYTVSGSFHSIDCREAGLLYDITQDIVLARASSFTARNGNVTNKNSKVHRKYLIKKRTLMRKASWKCVYTEIISLNKNTEKRIIAIRHKV